MYGLSGTSRLLEVGRACVTCSPWPLLSPIRWVTDDASELTEDDFGGIVLIIDNGVDKTFNLPAGLATGARAAVALVAFGPPTSATLTITGDSAAFLGRTVFSSGENAALLKLQDESVAPGFNVWDSPKSAGGNYTNSGRWTPSIASGVSVTQIGFWSFSRIGKRSNNGASAAGDIVRLRIKFSWELLDGESLNVDIGDLPAAISNNESVGASVSLNMDTGTDSFYLSASRADAGATLRLTASAASSGGSTGSADLFVEFEAAASA